jgi:predicted ATPase
LLSLEQLSGYEAVHLFVERARDLVPTFRLTQEHAAAIREICHRLEGLPLALELAAARIAVLSPQQIADRLSGQFRVLVSRDRHASPRHQTLSATIDWSYQLLSPSE